MTMFDYSFFHGLIRTWAVESKVLAVFCSGFAYPVASHPVGLGCDLVPVALLSTTQIPGVALRFEWF